MNIPPPTPHFGKTAAPEKMSTEQKKQLAAALAHEYAEEADEFPAAPFEIPAQPKGKLDIQV